MAHLRSYLHDLGVVANDVLQRVPHGGRARVAGHVIVRQRPGTAKGMLFLTLEDETGTCNVVITPPVFQRHRRILQTCRLLMIEGPVERVDGVTHVRGLRFQELTLPGPTPPSHDFH
jgi:error-prone DNA polymerase